MDANPDLAFLQRLSLTAAQTLDAASLVDLVIAETTGAMGVDVCSVYLLDDDGDCLVLTATNGLSQAGVGVVSLRIGEGITGWAAHDRKPVVVPDVRTERRFRWMAGVDQARFVSMCSVPVISADRLVGVINVQTDDIHHFSMAEVDFLVAIAAQIAGVLERSTLQRRLQAQVDQLRRSDEIHRRFTELSLTGAGLTAICAEIATHSAAAVALYDDDGARLASSDDDLPERLADLDDRRAARILPVRAGDIALGSLAVCADGEPDLVREHAVEHGVTVLALELSRERAAIETEHRLRGDLVEALLAQPLGETDVQRLTARAARLGMRLRRRSWLVVIEPDGDDGLAALVDVNDSRRVLRAVSRAADARHPGTMVVERGPALVMLIADPAAPGHVERTAELALAAATAVCGASFSAGVSGGSGGAEALYGLAEQARLALHVGRRMRRTNAVSSYRRLGAERIIAAAHGDADLVRFVDEWLGALIRQEQQGRASAPLLETIAALIDVSWSLRAAARRLNIHVNTLLYRLQRAREITGRDLDDPDVRLALALALRARTMIGDERIELAEPAVSSG